MNEFDIIATHAPEMNKKLSEKELEKIYMDFFYQSKYVLKKKHEITLISPSIDIIKKAAEKNSFSKITEKQAMLGEKAYFILKFLRVLIGLFG